MIDAIAKLLTDLGWALSEAGVRLSYNAEQIASNQYLGGKDFCGMKECLNYNNYCNYIWAGELGRPLDECPPNPYPSWCPGCTWDCFNADLDPASVLGNLLGFSFGYKGGELISDLGAIIAELADALKALV